ncbi:MAG: primosomal protein N', partial [Acidobacteria bacterium]|nr:primosomal protein N' [Acidobacteriota bacterium]
GGIRPLPIDRDPFEGLDLTDASVENPAPDRCLTGEQAVALDRLTALATTGEFRVALVHGVTGSGKTEIYLRLAAQVRAQGREVLVLVPEIALTPVLAAAFRSAFGNRVAIQHSGLSDGERHDQWQRIRNGGVDAVVGTRSAVFAPLASPGLIIVDEEHDTSYKQEESPRYHGRDLAIVRGQQANALVVLGSATPSLESFANARAGRYELITLERRVLDRPLASVRLVNMRDEYAEAGPDVILSRALAASIGERIARHEQVLVLLNRRGFATAVFCRQCGATLECPNCSVSLTVHGERSGSQRARCHYCNYSRIVPGACLRCAGPYLLHTGFGTERVEREIRLACPDARVARLDRDTARSRGAPAALLGQFARGDIDVLVGTQMIAKGHDFPRVTLVGVVSADVGLGLADFRAAERTFQLLTQVVGRAGRGERAGEAIIQTLFPDHYSIQHACRQDYFAFYEAEIRYRRAMHYPPVVGLISVIVRGRSLGEAMEVAGDLARRTRAHLPRAQDLGVLGPAPAPFVKLRGESRAQFLLKGPRRSALRAALDAALAERQDTRRKVSVDVDPMSVL